MVRLFLFALALVAIGFSIVVAAPAAADDTGANVTSDNVTADCEQIDTDVSLCDARLEDGDAVLDLHAESRVAIVLADSGAYIEGGEVGLRDVVLDEGHTTVRMPVTEARGFAGVSVNTEETLYAVPLEPVDDSQILPGEPSVRDVWVSVGTTVGIVVAALPISYLVVRRMRGVVRRVF